MKLTRRSLFRALLATPVVRALPAPRPSAPLATWPACGSFTTATIRYTAADAQFLTPIRFSVEEIAAFYRVPCHLIG